MRRRPYYFALILLLSACAASAPRGKPIPTEAAAALAEGFGRSSEFIALAFTNPVALATLPSLLAHPTLQDDICITEEGRGGDVDVDDIHEDLTLTFDCGSEESGSTLAGTLKVTDTNDDDALSGYTLELSDYKRVFFGETPAANDTVEVNMKATLVPEARTYRVTVAVQLAFEGETAQGELSFEREYALNPDSAVSPFKAGKLAFEGPVTFKSEAEYELGAKAADLHFASDCLNGFDGGSVSYTDPSGRELRLTHTGCAELRVTYDGVSLSAAPQASSVIGQSF